MARSQLGLTQNALATRLGISRASVANIEAGRQRIALHQAIDFAAALDVSSVTELLPVDLVHHSNDRKWESVSTTGSPLSKREAATIARIVGSS
jgi:DNA-binding XRE family transcriptional regulator